MSSFNINNKFPSVIDNFLDCKIQKINPKTRTNKLPNNTRQLINLPLPHIHLNSLYDRMMNKSKEKRKMISLEQMYKINKLNYNKVLPTKNKLVSNNSAYNNFGDFTNSDERFKSIKNNKQVNYFSNNNDNNNNAHNSYFLAKPLKNSQSIQLNSIRMMNNNNINEKVYEANQHNNDNNYKIRRTSNKLHINKYNSYDSLKNKTQNIIKHESIQNCDELNEKKINLVQSENIQEKEINENNIQKENKENKEDKENNNMFITRVNFAQNLNKFNKTRDKNYQGKKSKNYLFNTVNFGDLLKQLRENKKIISQNQNELEVMIKTAKDAQKELWHICDKNK